MANLKCNAFIIICLLPMLKAQTKKDCKFKPKDKIQARGCPLYSKVLIQHYYGGGQCKTKYSCYFGIVRRKERPFRTKRECISLCETGARIAPSPMDEYSNNDPGTNGVGGRIAPPLMGEDLNNKTATNGLDGRVAPPLMGEDLNNKTATNGLDGRVAPPPMGEDLNNKTATNGLGAQGAQSPMVETPNGGPSKADDSNHDPTTNESTKIEATTNIVAQNETSTEEPTTPPPT